MYLPKESFINSENADAVYQLFEEHYFSDLTLDPNRDAKVSQALRDLGEVVILDLFEKGQLAVD